MGFGSESIKWNFTKFLVDRNGTVVGRYAPLTKPEELQTRIEVLLGDVSTLNGALGRVRQDG